MTRTEQFEADIAQFIWRAVVDTVLRQAAVGMPILRGRGIVDSVVLNEMYYAGLIRIETTGITITDKGRDWLNREGNNE